jgi:CelD/BcsL family acetyltransferase involved in cellulose biosynthesis
MRRLEERGRVVMEELQPGDDCRAVTLIAVSHKRAWLKRRGGYSRAIGDPRFAAFFADAAGGAGPSTGVTASVLRCAGETTAINISLVCKGRQHLHIVVYSSKFERSAAGILHIEAAIHRAIDRGDAAFDFLVPRHDYKMAWASGTTIVNDYAVGCNAAGKAWAHGYWRTLRPWAKSLVERVTSRRTGATQPNEATRAEE